MNDSNCIPMKVDLDIWDMEQQYPHSKKYDYGTDLGLSISRGNHA